MELDNFDKGSDSAEKENKKYLLDVDENGNAKVDTDEYITGDISNNLPGTTLERLHKAGENAKKFFKGEKLEQNESVGEKAIYPEGKEGVIRNEAISSFYYIDKENGVLSYLVRERLDGSGVNTPGEEDPGVIFHGAIKDGVINVRRLTADWLGRKDDNSVTPQEIKETEKVLQDMGLKVNSLGFYILANGNKGRNEPIPTSGVFSALGVQCKSKDQLYEIEKSLTNILL